jgi:hypothetical protein
MSQGLTSVHVVDADLGTTGLRVTVQARNVSRREWGWASGDAHSVAEWCRLTGAVAGVNGGFFGAEVRPGRKEVIGLLKVGGTTFARAPVYRARGTDPIPYTHSTFGVVGGRRPRVDWVASDRDSMSRLIFYPGPEHLHHGRRWDVDCGLSGGPRLVHRGRRFVAARDERLVSAGALPRTFLGYSRSRKAGGNRFVLVTAAAMTYGEAADFLIDYFRTRYGVNCDEGMCLDGGHASQLAYRSDGEIISVHGEVTVPTCVLIHDDQLRVAGAPPAADPGSALENE